MRFTTYLFAFIFAILGPLNAATLSFLNTTNGGSTLLYSGSVQNNQEVRAGDYLIVFDFAGLADGQGPSPDWAFNLSNDVPDQDDNPSIPDAYFTYTGATTIVGQPGHTPLGTFLLTTSATDVHLTQGSYLFVTTRTDGGNAGSDVDESRMVTVVTTPEPGAILLVGCGLALVALGRRKVSGRSASSL